MNKIEEFRSLIKNNVNRQGVEDLLQWLEMSSFYKAPASTKYHECYEGGLVEHSLNVYYELKRLIKCFNLESIYDNSTITIVSLLHDVCKIGCYKEGFRWTKNEQNHWIQIPEYKWDEEFKFGGHGSKSVYLIQNFIKLSGDEAIAINCHMGVESLQNIGPINDAFRNCPLAFLLYVADMASTINFQFKTKEE